MCGDFQIKAHDGSIFCGRTMEFPFRQNSEVVTYNRGERFESTAPDGTKGLEWTSKYGFTGINAFHIDAPDEGLNEAGLSYGVLTLNGTTYQKVPADQNDRALAMIDLGKWILGSFATVQEVKEAISNVFVWGEFIKPMDQVPGLHIALHDTEGNNGVIEFIDGKVNFYENPNGVLTNEPPFPEQLANLEKYDLTPKNGMVGLAGSYKPEDHFVRLSYMSGAKDSKDAPYVKPTNAGDAFQRVKRVLNATDIPNGMEICNFVNHQFEIMTLWSTIKDLSNRVFYFRPSNETTFRAVYLKDYDGNQGLILEPGTIHPKLPVYVEKPTIINVTPQLNPANWRGWLGQNSAEIKLSELTYKTLDSSEKESTPIEAISNIAIASFEEQKNNLEEAKVG